MPAILVENLGKSYQLRHQVSRRGPKMLRESIVETLTAPWQKKSNAAAGAEREEFWAIRDLNFEVNPGEVVGIIGRNGAGKSTLLKVLSRITKPTTGRCVINGRVGSLLEVGTGFHPELSGRENIYMNGAILGMSHSEVKRNFDAIVDFAEVEKFLDTPVKRYSSGMYVRLAFAVAAHLEPEILIVDEVLAVGDATFQKKCLGKMEDVAKHGRTVLFVTHSMPMVQRLCTRAVLLESGAIKMVGKVQDAIKYYLNSDTNSPGSREWTNFDKAPGNEVAKLKAVRILNDQLQIVDVIDIERPCYIEIEYWKLDHQTPTNATYLLTNEIGTQLFVSADYVDPGWKTRSLSKGIIQARCKIPGNLLAEGSISVLAAISSINPDIIHAIESDAVQFQAVDYLTGNGARGEYARDWPGVVRPLLDWDVKYLETNEQR